MIENKIKYFCVIGKTSDEDGWHDLQTNSAWESNPYGDDYAVVPEHMIESILKTKGFCDIVLNNDGTEVVSFTQREIPIFPEPKAEPNAEDDINAMMIDHEYRLTLLELGVNE